MSTLPTSQLILQTLPLLHVRHNSFSNPSVALPTRHSSFYNPSVAPPSSQFILQPFLRFSYVASSSLNSPDEPPMHALLIELVELSDVTQRCYDPVSGMAEKLLSRNRVPYLDSVLNLRYAKELRYANLDAPLCAHLRIRGSHDLRYLATVFTSTIYFRQPL